MAIGSIAALACPHLAQGMQCSQRQKTLNSTIETLARLHMLCTWSPSTAAGVLGRGEYAAVFTRSKPTSRTSATVRWNCSSVSPEVWQQQA